MLILLIICVAAFLFLVWHSRLNQISLGIPIAYLFSMLLQHLPGGLAHWSKPDFFHDSSTTLIGLRFTTIGTVCFVIGTVYAQRMVLRRPGAVGRWTGVLAQSTGFRLFCLFSGWLVVFGVGPIVRISSLGAVIDQSGAIWILGVLLGLVACVKQGRLGHGIFWLMALAVYPLITLVLGGFLSFGSTSVFVVSAALLVVVRSHLRAYVGLVLMSLLCFLLFLSYFQNRDEIRLAAWEGGSLEQKVGKSSAILTSFAWFDPDNVEQLYALDLRLNQNQFAGMAAQKMKDGQESFLHGSSIAEGVMALVPRALWADKPIFAGSSELISRYTDIQVNEVTTYGVGQVMEFYLNFGVPGVIIGFLFYGFVFGWLDRKCAIALQEKRYGDSITCFLPLIGMINPLVSIAEVMGNVGAAVVAAWGWRYVWRYWERKSKKALIRHPTDEKTDFKSLPEESK